MAGQVQTLLQAGSPLCLFSTAILTAGGLYTALRGWLPMQQSQGENKNKDFLVRTSVWGWLV